MKGKKLLAATLLLFAWLAGHAQQDTVNTTQRGRDISVQYGYGFKQYHDGTLDDFKKLAPNSAVLQQDPRFLQEAYLGANDPVATVSVLLGINLNKTNRKTAHQWRTGLTYVAGGGLQVNYWYNEKTPYDVLTSAQTGNVFYIDSVTQVYTGMEYRSEQLRLDNAYVVRFNPAARLSLFTGAGITAGISLNSYTELYSNTSKGTEGRDDQNYAYYYYGASSATYLYEQKRNKTSFGVSGYVPVGLDLRLAKSSNLFGRMHLYVEARPGINMLHIPELGTYAKANLTAALGMRVQL